MIVDAFPLSDCFYITFDEHGNVFSYKLEKGKKQVIRKMYVNVREKMKEWGVEAEKGEGIKEEEKQRQYDEMIELRRQQRKKIQSKGADCTNLKEYQQEVIKIRDFLQITMVILITVLLIWTGLSAEEGERIPILILEFLIDAPLLFFSSKVVTLSKEGCKISYLFFKKMYKWEELEIIREDYFPSFRDRRSRGIVFSKRKKNKAGYIYTTREIVGSGHILECFYIVLDADGNIHLYKRLAAKDGKIKLRKVAVNIPQKLAEWGVEMEKMILITQDDEGKELEYPQKDDWEQLKKYIGNECRLMQHVQPVRLYTEIGAGHVINRHEPGEKVSMMVDEEFLFNSKAELNKIASYLYQTDIHGEVILGNVLIVGEKYENEEISLCGLSDKQFHIIFPKLKKIEEHLKKVGKV